MGIDGFSIAEARFLAPDVKLFRVVAPRVARKQQPGQFVIIRIHEHGERIPLTIAQSNPTEGTITIIVQGIGKTTKLLNRWNAGDSILDVVGPLGRPSDVRLFGTVVVISGGVGTAIAYPIAKALRQAGNHVITILGARTKNLIILEGEARVVSDEVFVTTDDGSYGERGLVTHKLDALIAGGRKIDLVLAIGPIPMMRAVAEKTRPHGIKTIVSLNPIMVDGTGMCGGCRVQVAGRSQFACVDGPEFDAHEVDFDGVAKRNAMYRASERQALERFVSDPESGRELIPHRCKLEDVAPR
jgi:ferredoxin--NADP+ reductase